MSLLELDDEIWNMILFQLPSTDIYILLHIDIFLPKQSLLYKVIRTKKHNEYIDSMNIHNKCNYPFLRITKPRIYF